MEVLAYSINDLCSLFERCAHVRSAVVVQGKLHRQYFEDYFEHIGAKTIVVEPSYTDRGFLEDYAGYYVRCFGTEHSKYRSRCSRLHFFRIAFDRDEFRRAMRGESQILGELCLNGAYLGFIVVKPLPETFIGRTCLRNYDDDKRRHYPVTRKYEVHLGGFNLEVKSLAFQEQDKVAAACATSALWSLFQKTGMLFHHHIPSPLEITRTATELLPLFGRDLPSTGLAPVQVAAAIKKVDLEPEMVNIPTEASLQATTYAYLKAGVPLMLSAALYDTSPPVMQEDHEPRFLGGHAVAVTGYSTGRPACIPYEEVGTLFTSSRIDKLYVHDDQVGPFARLAFGAPPLQFPASNKDKIQLILSSSWRGEDGVAGGVVFACETLIVPLYRKIRIQLTTIRGKILELDDVIENRRQEKPDLLNERLEWDVFLTTEHDLKEDLRTSRLLPGDELCGLLEEPLPRFIWRAIALHGGARLLEILFDATDIEQGDYLLRIVWYNKELMDKLFA